MNDYANDLAWNPNIYLELMLYSVLYKQAWRIFHVYENVLGCWWRMASRGHVVWWERGSPVRGREATFHGIHRRCVTSPNLLPFFRRSTWIIEIIPLIILNWIEINFFNNNNYYIIQTVHTIPFVEKKVRKYNTYHVCPYNCLIDT